MAELFSREDWTLFRSVSTLSQKAGVPASMLGALAVKELVDNALDEGANVTVTQEGEWLVITDDGPGIDQEILSTLFSIRRPLSSSKIVRLPRRGALGNGLRVVMGTVYASRGEIHVETGGQDDDVRNFNLVPMDDGHTVAEELPPSGQIETGTRIKIKIGHITDDQQDLDYYYPLSIDFSEAGKVFKGKTSPWWYDTSAWFEMLQAAGNRSFDKILRLIRDIPSDIINEYKGVPCNAIDRDKAEAFLITLRGISKEPATAVLGNIGDSWSGDWVSARESGTISLGQGTRAQLPVVVDVVMAPVKAGRSDSVLVMVNRTMITGQMRLRRGKATELDLFGCGLAHAFKVPKVPVQLIISVITPYQPITTDGKEPDFRPAVGIILKAVEKASRKFRKDNAHLAMKGKGTQKQIIEQYLQEGIDKASGNGRYRYSLRQLYYAIRPFVLSEAEATEKGGLDYNYFGAVITQIEAEKGSDLPGMYRDPRGVIYHPHTHEDIPLGTLNVEKYKRPEWTFNKILYIEKGGFFSLLKDEGWPDRNDCALMTSQGFASRAARDVLDLLGESKEPLYFFCIHDADASGTMIYQALTEATKARPGRTVKVINLGLEPEEGVNMGLEVETHRTSADVSKRKLPTADYLTWEWQDWLQTQRIELNAMTSPQFLEWLDEKFQNYVGKIVPPGPVINQTYLDMMGNTLSTHLTEKVKIEGNYEARFSDLFNSVEPETVTDLLTAAIRCGIQEQPELKWTAPLEVKADQDAKAMVEDEATATFKWREKKRLAEEEEEAEAALQRMAEDDEAVKKLYEDEE